MPDNRQTPWLVCYDIADPRRLGRVHRELSRNAVPLQYSVFFAVSHRRNVARILERVADKIDCKSDDLRAYPLMIQGRHQFLGTGILSDGVIFNSFVADTPEICS